MLHGMYSLSEYNKLEASVVFEQHPPYQEVNGPVRVTMLSGS